jgi:ABC-2 type transport system permease protein
MKILAIVKTNLIRALRDRTALFFSVLLPLVLVLVLGLTYGSGRSARIGLVDLDGGAFTARLVDGLRASSDLAVDVRRYDSVDALRDAASRGIVQVGVVVPADYTATLASGGQATVTLVVPPTAVASAMRTSAELAIAAQAAEIRAARFSGTLAGTAFDPALAQAQKLAASVPGVATRIEPINAADTSSGGFDAGAQSQLILFMFLTSLTGASEIVITRQLGISRRMFSTPTGISTIILGESLARVAFALLQGAFLIAATAILFGVHWGDPLGVAILVLIFGLVSGGASMIVGGLASNPSQAGAIGPALAMLLGLVGGAMVPTEVFPETMRQLAHLTPHAWAVEGLRALGEPGAGIGSIAVNISVLAAFAAAFFAVAVVRFRRVLQSGS